MAPLQELTSRSGWVVRGSIMPYRIGVIAFPVTHAGVVPLSNLVKLLSKVAKDVFVISSETFMEAYESDTGRDNVHIYPVKQPGGSNRLNSATTELNLHVQSSIEVYKIRDKTDLIILFFGADIYVAPAMVAKVLNKKLALLLPGSVIEKKATDGFSFYNVNVSSFINRQICNKIILYSPSLISRWSLQKHRHKILIAYEHFLDFDIFSTTIPLVDRPPLIGYIGRLSEEKGIRRFIQALPAIFNDRPDLRALIGGDGDMGEAIEASLQEGGLAPRVDLAGWISHDDLPGHLNQLQLLIIPSYTEGLPNIMLEAMACGTPVLATPVGAIPDIIVDGRTGFLMENNSPECIAKNVIRALNSPDLEQITETGRQFVEEHFTFERVAEKWRDVLGRV